MSHLTYFATLRASLHELSYIHLNCTSVYNAKAKLHIYLTMTSDDVKFLSNIFVENLAKK